MNFHEEVPNSYKSIFFNFLKLGIFIYRALYHILPHLVIRSKLEDPSFCHKLASPVTPSIIYKPRNKRFSIIFLAASESLPMQSIIRRAKKLLHDTA